MKASRHPRPQALAALIMLAMSSGAFAPGVVQANPQDIKPVPGRDKKDSASTTTVGILGVKPAALPSSALSTVIATRNRATESELQQLARTVAGNIEPVSSAWEFAYTGLPLAPQGIPDAAPLQFPANSGLMRLPPPFTNRMDADGNMLGYCPFDVRGAAVTGEHRLTGRVAKDGSPIATATSFAIVSPGANGRFEYTCEQLNLVSGLPTTPKGPDGRPADDIVILLNHADVGNAATLNGHLASSVERFSDLAPLRTTPAQGGVFTGQVRLVRNLNQFFVATVTLPDTSTTPSIVWSPLTPSLMRSGLTANQANLAWMSGGISIGNGGSPIQPSVLDSPEPSGLTSVLTLGSRRSLADGATLEQGVLQSGIAFMDASGSASVNPSLRAWMGLTGSMQDAFVIRHGVDPSVSSSILNYRDRLRIEADGRLWLGDIPATSAPTGTLPAIPGSRASVTLAGNVTVFTDAATGSGSNGYLLLGLRNGSSHDLTKAAGLRFFSSRTAGSGMELRLLDFSTGVPLTGNGDILFNTTGGTGIAHIPGAALTHTLDVNGSARVRGALQVDAGASPNMVLLAEGNNDARLQLQTVDGNRRLTLGMPAGGDTRGRLSLGDTNILSFLADGSGELTATTGTPLQVNRRVTIGPDTTETGFILTVNGAAQFKGSVLGNGLTVLGSTTLDSLTAAAATFSSAVTVSRSLTAAAAFNATGGLDVNNSVLNAGAGLLATSGSFSGSVRAQQGLSVSRGMLTANAGVTVSNALLSLSNDLSVTGDGRLRNDLQVNGNATVEGQLTVRGQLIGRNTGSLNFSRYTDRGNTTSTKISNTITYSATSALSTIYLEQPNTHLYGIDQPLSTSSTPTFGTLSVGAGGLTSSGVVEVIKPAVFRGTLTGNADSASTLKTAQGTGKTLTLNFKLATSDLAPYRSLTFDLGDSNAQTLDFNVNPDPNRTNDIVDQQYRTSNHFGASDNRSTTLTLQTLRHSLNIECTKTVDSNGVTTLDSCSLANDQTTALTLPDGVITSEKEISSRTYNYGTDLATGAVSLTYTDLATTLAGMSSASPLSGVLVQAPRLIIRSQVENNANEVFMPEQRLLLTGGSTQTIQIRSRGLELASSLDQAVTTTSTPTFRQLTVHSPPPTGSTTSSTINGLVQANQVAIQSTLKGKKLEVTDPGASNSSASIALDSAATQIDIGGSAATHVRIEFGSAANNSVITATRFEGVADRAVRLTAPLQFAFTGAFTAQAQPISNNPNQYTVPVVLRNQILDGGDPGLVLGITSGKIANDSIIAANFGLNAVKVSHISSGSLTGRIVAPGAILRDHLKSDSVDGNALADQSVNTDQLATDAVTADKLKGNSVTTDKLSTTLFSKLPVSASDIRLKTAVTPLAADVLLGRLAALHLYGYRMIDDPSGRRRLGVLAQELQPLFPEMVTLQTLPPHAGFFAVNHAMLASVAASGAGELHRQMQRLGLQAADNDTLSLARGDQLLARHITLANAKVDRLQATTLEARTVDADRTNIRHLELQRSQARSVQADLLNSGDSSGPGNWPGLPLFVPASDGHYLVQTGSDDGMSVTVSVAVAAGQISILPLSGEGLTVGNHMGMIHVYAPGRLVRASWLRTG